jgi:hypothetical protein
MENSENNVFVQKLIDSKIELEACQQEKQHDSCSKCDEYLECKLRKTYVQHVYGSMSQGQTGGFEF